MPLINCKIHLELNWAKNCVMPDNDDDTKFKITNTKLYVPIATLSTKDNVGLIKQLTGGFQKPVYWNDYKTNIESKDSDDSLTSLISILLFKELKDCLFLLLITLILMLLMIQLTILIIRDSHRKYFLPRLNITNYNVLIDGRKFYHEPIND